MYNYWFICGYGYLLMMDETFKTDGGLHARRIGMKDDDGTFKILVRYQNLSFQNSTRFYPFASRQCTRSPLLYDLRTPIILPKQNVHTSITHNPSIPFSRSCHTNPQTSTPQTPQSPPHPPSSKPKKLIPQPAG